MRILVWNVNSLVPTVRNIVLRDGSLEKFFASYDADIICVQEAKLPDAKLTKDLVLVPGYQSYWATSKGKTGYSGVTTWARTAWAAGDARADCLHCGELDEEGRVVESDHGAFVLLNVYVPNAGDRPARARLELKLSFLRALKAQMDEVVAAGREVLAVGDFNIAASRADVHPAINYDTMYADEERALMAELLQGYTDTWRHLHPNTADMFSVWEERTSARAFNVGCRIDYILCSPRLLPHLTSCEVLQDLPPKWSDHAPVLAEFSGLMPTPAAAGGGAVTGGSQQAAGPAAAAAAAAARPPCAMWQQLLKRFQDPAQKSIAGMFGAVRKQQQQKQQGGTGSGNGSSTLAAGPSGAAPTTAAAAVGSKRSAEQQQQQSPSSKWRQHESAVDAADQQPSHQEDKADAGNPQQQQEKEQDEDMEAAGQQQQQQQQENRKKEHTQPVRDSQQRKGCSSKGMGGAASKPAGAAKTAGLSGQKKLLSFFAPVNSKSYSFSIKSSGLIRSPMCPAACHCTFTASGADQAARRHSTH